MDVLDPTRLRPFPILTQRDKLSRLRAFDDRATALAARLRRLDADCAAVAAVVRSLERRP
jgi:hypothetical protein